MNDRAVTALQRCQQNILEQLWSMSESKLEQLMNRKSFSCTAGGRKQFNALLLDLSGNPQRQANMKVKIPLKAYQQNLSETVHVP